MIKKLTCFNRRITSNKTKHLEVQKNLDSLITEDYKFFLGRIYFSSNDDFEICLPIFNVLELKIHKGTEYIVDWKSKGVYNFKLVTLHGVFYLT